MREPSIALPPPLVEERPSRRRLHGVELVDPFAWLKAANWREVLRDPSRLPADIRAHLQAENAYADAVLSSLAGLRRSLVAELRDRLEPSEDEPPLQFGPDLYQARFEPGAEHPVIRRWREGEAPRPVLDAATLAAGHAFFALGSWKPCPRGHSLAYAVDTGGAELFTIRVRDLESGRDRAEAVAETTGRMVWTRDGRGFLYVGLDAEHRPRRVAFHRLGTDPADDLVLHREPDPDWSLSVEETSGGEIAVIAARRSDESELRLVRLDDVREPRLLHPRAPEVRAELDHGGGPLVIRTNLDGAEDFKLMTAPLEAPGREAWRTLVPHRPGIALVAHRVIGRHVVRLEREDALPRLVVQDLGGGPERAIALPEEVSALTLSPVSGLRPGTLRYTLSNPVRPPAAFDLEVETGRSASVWRKGLRRPPDPAAFVARRAFALAPDGERVPVSVVHRRDVQGGAPCLLTAYGSYGFALQPVFVAERLPLLERGVVLAIAHVRGGSERGQRWYRAAKFAGKPNSFTDFIAAAEHLVAEGLTRRGRIVAQGRSAGGLLMGAVANRAPQLFAGIVAEVPFVDALNTMLDEDLPLTPPEWLEWGDPVRDSAAFATIRAYSPYDQIRPQLYPPILATGGLTDPRVTYWEPAKWIARLRATATAGGPFLLRTNMAAGHAGLDGRLARLEEQALTLAFTLHCLGLV